jgi:hypothetical protein
MPRQDDESQTNQHKRDQFPESLCML